MRPRGSPPLPQADPGGASVHACHVRPCITVLRDIVKGRDPLCSQGLARRHSLHLESPMRCLYVGSAAKPCQMNTVFAQQRLFKYGVCKGYVGHKQ